MRLKKEGVIVICNNKQQVIKWQERSSRKRVYFYLVCMRGKTLENPYRLKPHEIQYWIDTIGNDKMCQKGENKNGRD
jgi:hypothetical protein